MSVYAKLVKSTFIIMVITVVSKIFGFLRETTFVKFFGLTINADAYNMASTLPNIIFISIALCFANSFVPVYSNLYNRKEEKKANLFTSSVINILVIFSLVATFLGIVFTGPIVRILTLGSYKGKLLDLTVMQARIMFLMFIFVILSYFFSAFLNARMSFIVPQFAGIPMSLAVIASIVFFSPKYGIAAVSIGTVIGSALQVMIMLPALRGKLKYYPVLGIDNENTRHMFRMALPVLCGSVVHQANSLFDRMLASRLGAGNVSAIKYANMLMGFVLGVIIMAIATVVYSQLSKLHSLEHKISFNRVVKRALAILTIILLPLTVGSIIFCQDIIRIVYQRGAFDAGATKVTAAIFAFYALGMIPMGINEVMTRAFYAIKNSKTPLKVGLVSVSINVVLNLVLIRFLQARGLALASALSLTFSSFALCFLLSKHIGKECFFEFLAEVPRIVACAAVAVPAALFMNSMMRGYTVEIRFPVVMLVAGLIYGGLLILLKVDEAVWAAGSLKQWLEKRKAK